MNRHAIELLIAMTEREIKARYKHAVLGFLWIILNPLLQMIVMGTVFSFIFHVGIADYFLFLFTGLTVWNFFSLTITKVTPAIVYELPLIEKAYFPREVIVLSILFSNLFHTIITYVLFIILLVIVHPPHLQKLFVLPLALIWLATLAGGIGLFTSALNVKYRDMNFFVQAAMPLLFYATPIVYAASLVPEQLRGLLFINPLTSIIQIFQWMFINHPFPESNLLIANGALTGVILIVGVLVFRKESPFFDDWT